MLWVLLIVTHVNAGSAVHTQEFLDKPSCEFASKAIRQMNSDLNSTDIKTWCVTKGLPNERS